MRQILLLIFVTVSISLIAQDPYYYKIDQTRGLPSNTVFDIFQDSKGFMWIATSRGLCKYDGTRFEVFKSEKQSSVAGSDIQEDKYHRIWYVSFDGYIYYIQNDTLKEFKQKTTVGFLNIGIVSNYLICVEPGYIVYYDLKTLSIRKKIRFDTTKIIATSSDKSNFYVLSGFLYSFDETGKVCINKHAKKFYDNIQGPIIKSSKYGVYLGSKYDSELYLINHSECKRINRVGNFMQNFSHTQDALWISTTDGIERLADRSTNGILQHYYRGLNATTVFQDNEGAHWIGTVGDGIIYVSDFDSKSYNTPFQITSLTTTTKGNTIFGTKENTIYQLNTANLQTKLLHKNDILHEVYLLWNDTLSNRIFSTSNVFSVLNAKGETLVNAKIAVKDICRISNKYYAFAASGMCGLIWFNNQLDELDSYLTKYKKIRIGKMNLIYLLESVRGKSVEYKLSDGSIFFATNRGFFRWNKGKMVEYLRSGNTKLFFNQIAYIRSSLFGLTAEGNLLKLNDIDKTINIGVKRLNGSIKYFKRIGNSLFLFTANTLFEYDIVHEKINQLLSVHSQIELTDIQMSNGKLIISTTKGYIIQDYPKKPVQSQAKLLIKSVSAKQYVFDSFDKETHLTHDQHDIRIDFSIISYNPNAKVFLQYKINDKPWITIDDNRQSLELTGLKPGIYKIILRGIGDSYTKEQSLSFIIEKPFWLEWWFFFLSILLLGVIIYFYDSWRTTQINKKSLEIIEKINLEKSANVSKLKAIKAQMNPHFFFNALNTVQSYILENDKKQALTYLNKFSGLTRSILEMSDKEEVTLAEEIKVLRLYLDIEKARFYEDFEYTITIPDIDLESIRIPSLLLQPYVENAIKHGLLHKSGIKKLAVRFEHTNHQLSIYIEDNGIGRKRSKELNAIKKGKHLSFATKANENRIKLHNEFTGSRISITYFDNTNSMGVSTGTSVVITIPLQ